MNITQNTTNDKIIENSIIDWESDIKNSSFQLVVGKTLTNYSTGMFNVECCKLDKNKPKLLKSLNIELYDVLIVLGVPTFTINNAFSFTAVNISLRNPVINLLETSAAGAISSTINKGGANVIHPNGLGGYNSGVLINDDLEFYVLFNKQLNSGDEEVPRDIPKLSQSLSKYVKPEERVYVNLQGYNYKQEDYSYCMVFGNLQYKCGSYVRR